MSEIAALSNKGLSFDYFLGILFFVIVVFFVRKFIYLTHLKSKQKFKNFKESLSSGKHSDDGN